MQAMGRIGSARSPCKECCRGFVSSGFHRQRPRCGFSHLPQIATGAPFVHGYNYVMDIKTPYICYGEQGFSSYIKENLPCSGQWIASC
jgi:hypothetical protein